MENGLHLTKNYVYQNNCMFYSQGDFIKVTKEEKNKPTEIAGRFADVWHALERKLNFS
jgi:hypothetical protein